MDFNLILIIIIFCFNSKECIPFEMHVNIRILLSTNKHYFILFCTSPRAKNVP